MKCKIHPKYKGILRPRVKFNVLCSCWQIYMEKNPNKKMSNPITGEKNWITYGEWRKRAEESAKWLIGNIE